MKYTSIISLIACTSAMKVNKYSHRTDTPNSEEEQTSEIIPYVQRDHAWTEGQFDMEDEVKFHN